jgi:hypothetical protein
MMTEAIRVGMGCRWQSTPRCGGPMINSKPNPDIDHGTSDELST